MISNQTSLWLLVIIEQPVQTQLPQLDQMEWIHKKAKAVRRNSSHATRVSAFSRLVQLLRSMLGFIWSKQLQISTTIVLPLMTTRATSLLVALLVLLHLLWMSFVFTSVICVALNHSTSPDTLFTWTAFTSPQLMAISRVSFAARPLFEVLSSKNTSDCMTSRMTTTCVQTATRRFRVALFYESTWQVMLSTPMVPVKRRRVKQSLRVTIVARLLP